MIEGILDIPGYREAVAGERSQRDASFVDAPECVAGFSISSFTLRRFLILQSINHPLLRGAIPSPHELVGFLWLMNPEYEIGARYPRAFARAASELIPSSRPGGNGFWSRVKARKTVRCQLKAAHVIGAIRNWLDAQFMDAGGGMHIKNYVKEYWSMGISVVFQLAQETGWSEQAILDMPLRRLFQYRKFLRKTLNPKAPLFNPSDCVLGDWMKTQDRS